MPRRPVSTNSFNAVGAGQTATVDLPVGPRVYHQLRLLYGTSTAGGANQTNIEAEISQIRLKVNGKAQRTFSAAELFKINALHNRPFNTGQLPIFLGEPWRRTTQGSDALAWGMADVATFQVEVDVAAGATGPTLDARVVVEEAARPMGPIAKWKRLTQPITAIGITTNTTFPRVDDYYSIYAFSSNISDVEVKLDQQEVFKLTAAQLQYLLEDQDFTWVSGLFPVKFDFTRRVSDSLKMMKPNGQRASELRVDWNMSTAADFSYITETVGLRD